MTAVTAMVIIDDGAEKTIHSMDVVEVDGCPWLVPEWLDFPHEKVTMPARIVSLMTIPHERGQGSSQIVVSGPVPKFVFDGQVPPELKALFVVIERPDIRLPLPSATH